jgi:hypothetical protein
MAQIALNPLLVLPKGLCFLAHEDQAYTFWTRAARSHALCVSPLFVTGSP